MERFINRRLTQFLMVWIREGDNRYVVSITDGYMDDPSENVISSGATSHGQAAVKRLFGLAKRLHVPDQFNPQRPDPLHIWLVGSDDWIRTMPQPFLAMSEHEDDPNYRVLIVGEGIRHMDTYVHSWNAWPRQVGMSRKKKHRDVRAFRSAAIELAAGMFDYYGQNHIAPTAVLENLRVPFEFYGD